jgi:hypothetical protein
MVEDPVSIEEASEEFKDEMMGHYEEMTDIFDDLEECLQEFVAYAARGDELFGGKLGEETNRLADAIRSAIQGVRSALRPVVDQISKIKDF